MDKERLRGVNLRPMTIYKELKARKHDNQSYNIVPDQEQALYGLSQYTPRER